MKHILLTSIAAVLCALPAFGEVEKKSVSSSSYAVVSSDGKGTGKAVVTIEVNGKKETREIDLGSGNTKIEISSDGIKPEKGERVGERVIWLGVAPEELPPAVAAQLPPEASQGVLVSSVLPDSPAAIAGLAKNDVIVKVDDQPIENPKQLQKIIASRKEGDSVRVSYFRRGQKAEAEAKLAVRVETESENPKLNILRNGNVNSYTQLLKGLGGLGAGLTIDKEIIVVDKDGNVVSRDKKEVSEKLERELARVREQLEAMQDKVAIAVKRAEEAARAAAEAAKKSLEQ
jgi:membrane-associated protease RseP (regulator of RpoE activity)